MMAKPITILVVDDDELHLQFVREALKPENVEVHTAPNGATGLALFREKRPHGVLLDLVLPDIGGMQLLPQMLAADPGAEIILMTGNYSTDSAVEAIRNGASDYLDKPLDLQRLRQRIGNLVAAREKRRHAKWLDEEAIETFTFEGIVGRSPLMLDLYERIRRVGPHFQTALVTGPTGTGKELVAEALHRSSPHPSKPLMVCNCSAITETLVESELFGYVRGAFTGATEDKIGLFEAATGGTVFLDEIGELSLSAQAKLLRVLQQREVQRLGSPGVRKVDVRVVAATNRKLRTLVQEKLFREDLFYRLSMIEITLPPLWERKEDLALLERHFLQRFSARQNRNIRGLTLRAQQVLNRHDWPGNVRELENVLGHACMFAEAEIIDIHHLPEYLRARTQTAVRSEGMVSLEEVQRSYARRVLERVEGNKARAAEVLGISRTTLYALLRENKPDATC
jgi:DNA-binding NtrC family response regulator